MKLFATVISAISLAGFSWAACPIPSPLNLATVQESELQDLRHIGFAYYRDGQYQGATACYAQAVRTAQALDIANAATVGDLHNLAVLAEEMGDYVEAGNYSSRELDLLNQLGEGASAEAGDVYTKLGELLLIQGLFSEAEINYKKAVDLLTQHAGVENLRTAKALNGLGRLYIQLGRVMEASPLVRQAFAIAQKSLPEDSPQLLLFYDSEAFLLSGTGKFREAEKRWLTALRIAEHASGKTGSEYSLLVVHLGQMYSIIGDYKAAVPMLQHGLAVEDKIRDSNPLIRALLMSSLAKAYAKQRRLAQAEPLVIESAEAVKFSCSASPIPCAHIRSNLGAYYMTRGQWETAEREFERALKLRQDALGEGVLVADSMISLSRALRKVNRKKEAKMYEAQVGRILSSQRNPIYDRGNTIDVRALQANNR
jgi:tetratricopeptide (TPR) repeat protein